MIGDDVRFVPINDAIFPVPLAGNPIAVLEFVQANVAPAGVLVKFEAGIVAPLQYELFAGTVTVGVGFTVIVNVDGGPGQLAGEGLVGVTVIVAVTGDDVTFVAVNEAILPVPLAAKPIVASEFVHANVDPATLLVKLIAGTVALLQYELFAGTVTFGVGLTVIV